MGEGVQPGGAPRALRAGHRALHDPGEHHRLEAEFANGVVELGDRFLRREHRNGRNRREPIFVARITLCVVAIESPGHRAAQVVVRESRDRQAVSWIEQRVVEAEFVHPAVHDLRGHRGRAVQGVARRDAPPGHARHAQPPLGFLGHLPGEHASLRELVKLFRDALAGFFDQEVSHDGDELDQMPIAVDHRMVELALDLIDGVTSDELHWGAP